MIIPPPRNTWMPEYGYRGYDLRFAGETGYALF
jgi:hypothetical protein